MYICIFQCILEIWTECIRLTIRRRVTLILNLIRDLQSWVRTNGVLFIKLHHKWHHDLLHTPPPPELVSFFCEDDVFFAFNMLCRLFSSRMHRWSAISPCTFSKWHKLLRCACMKILFNNEPNSIHIAEMLYSFLLLYEGRKDFGVD